jgi:hypothetical protein
VENLCGFCVEPRTNPQSSALQGPGVNDESTVSTYEYSTLGLFRRSTFFRGESPPALSWGCFRLLSILSGFCRTRRAQAKTGEASWVRPAGGFLLCFCLCSLAALWSDLYLLYRYYVWHLGTRIPDTLTETETTGLFPAWWISSSHRALHRASALHICVFASRQPPTGTLHLPV